MAPAILKNGKKDEQKIFGKWRIHFNSLAKRDLAQDEEEKMRQS